MHTVFNGIDFNCSKVNDIILNKKYLKTELDLDFILIAITSQLKDYRLCFLINKFLNMEFERTSTDYQISYPNSSAQYFSQYHCKNYLEKDCYIIANRGIGGLLIPEMKETDYFMLLRNYLDEEDIEYILAGLKSINEIQVATEINPVKLKSKENLIF